MITVFCSLKGGVGKTTTAIHMAVMLKEQGKKVVLLKADKNDDLFVWRDIRQQNNLPEIPVVPVTDIRTDIKRLNYDFLIIDCSGHDSTLFREILLLADLVLTFIKPSSVLEKSTLTKFTGAVRSAQQFNPRLDARIVLSRVQNTSKKLRAAIELERELRSDPVWMQPLKTRISQLDIFEDAVNAGAEVHEVQSASSLNKSQAQIELIAQELKFI